MKYIHFIIISLLLQIATNSYALTAKCLTTNPNDSISVFECLNSYRDDDGSPLIKEEMSCKSLRTQYVRMLSVSGFDTSKAEQLYKKIPSCRTLAKAWYELKGQHIFWSSCRDDLTTGTSQHITDCLAGYLKKNKAYLKNVRTCSAFYKVYEKALAAAWVEPRASALVRRCRAKSRSLYSDRAHNAIIRGITGKAPVDKFSECKNADYQEPIHPDYGEQNCKFAEIAYKSLTGHEVDWSDCGKYQVDQAENHFASCMKNERNTKKSCDEIRTTYEMKLKDQHNGTIPKSYKPLRCSQIMAVLKKI